MQRIKPKTEPISVRTHCITVLLYVAGTWSEVHVHASLPGVQGAKRMKGCQTNERVPKQMKERVTVNPLSQCGIKSLQGIKGHNVKELDGRESCSVYTCVHVYAFKISNSSRYSVHVHVYAS